MLNEKNIYLHLLSYLLFPLSALYYLVISLRNYLYDKSLLSVNMLNSKVVSVGNLTLGGTGKTPLVECITRVMQNRNFNIALLSRGYARRERIPLTVVSNGKEILVGVDKAGDEPLLLAKNLSGVIVIVDKNRYKAGLLAEDNFRANFFILDDGFQHRKLKRDINLVVINGKNPLGKGWLFPAGTLREPLRSLKRADAIVITEPLSDNNEKAMKRVIMHYKPNISIFHSYRSPAGFYLVDEDKPLAEDYFNKKKIISLSAIANPSTFEEDLTGMGFNLIKTYRFIDHHYYTQKEIDDIAAFARQAKAEAIITTQKDAMRLQRLKRVEPSFIYLRIELKLREEEEFREFLHNSLAY